VSQAALLVLAFLDLLPPPTCTPARPYGLIEPLGEQSCPRDDLGNDSGISEKKFCTRRFTI
jgi:hypothetical protein